MRSPHSAMPPSGLELLTEAQQEWFNQVSYGPAQGLPFACIHHAFEHHAAATPDAIAVEHHSLQITFGELNFQADRLARKLVELGVSPGDHVGLFVERSIPMVVGIMAILKAGAAYVPQDARITPPQQLGYIMGAAKCRVILCLEHLRDRIPVLSGHHYLAIDDFMSMPAASIAHNMQPVSAAPLPALAQTGEQTCYVLFTSGTTGVPNGVQVSHRNVCNILLSAPGHLNIRHGTRVAQILNIAFDMAAWEILGCLANGGTLVIRGKDIRHSVHTANVIISTPSVLAQIAPTDCPAVQLIAVAGEACPLPLASKWRDICDFYNGCGPTETTIVNTMQHFSHAMTQLTIGKPTPNNSVYVLDADGHPCQVGEPGEMWAGGAGVSTGYLNNPALNAERYRPDPFLGNGHVMFRTRDLARWNDSGELEHLGRIDDQVKVRGFRVELDSVSAQLENAPGCERAVTLQLDASTLVAFITPAHASTEDALAQVQQQLPYYCVPATILALDTLPVTARGKIDKAALLALLPPATTHNTGQAVQAVEKASLLTTPLPAPMPLHRRIGTLPLFMHYNRLVLMVVLGNLTLLGYGLFGADWWRADTIVLGALANAVLANFALAVIVRQQLVVNLLFWLATRLPVSCPLYIRRHAAKVYHFGGMHSSGAAAATLWFIVLTASAAYHYAHDLPGASGHFLTISFLLLAILCGMIFMAQPDMRSRFHNAFERMHRFGGWTALLLFWLHTIVFIQDQNTDISNVASSLTLTYGLMTSPQFWVLTLLTLSIISPWLHLRRVKVEITRPSPHAAIVRFNHGVTPFPGSSTAISRSPLVEWHSFANIPTPGQQGFRLIISRAGDWTGRFIDEQPSHVWVKGITTAGVAYIETLFKSVVYVATGSGIGPVLPHLLAQKVPIQLIWSTKNPRKTYGDALVDEILRLQPDAIIWDTDEKGKPDLLQLTYALCQRSQSEAVICIANRKLTGVVVEGMEGRGIPAYGAIWDS